MRFVNVLILALLVTATAAMAFAPATTSFQGRVTQSNGLPVSDGSYQLTFRVYTVAGGGSPIWTSTRTVTVMDGVFSVVLGQVNPLNLPFDQQYFVGVQYQAEPEMTPRAPLAAVPYALGVSEDHAVTELNNLTGDINLIGGTNVNISPSGNNLVISASGGGGGDNDWTVSGPTMYSNNTGNVGVGTNSPQHKLQTVGDVAAGDGSTPAYLRGYNGAGYTSVFGGDYSGEGGEISMAQENGIDYMFLQPDFDGDGAFLQLYDGNGGTAFQVDGKVGPNDNAVISGFGTSNFIINLNSTGDTAVQLPAEAIASAEILDEPGLASRNDHATSSYPLTSSLSTVTSRTISVPADGYLLVTSSMEIELNHQGSSCYATTGLSLTTSLPNNQDLSYYLPTGAAQGLYLSQSSPTAVFEVSAGSHTVNILANAIGTTDAVIWDAQLNVLFIPTAYGAVALASDSDDGRQFQNDRVSPAISAADAAAEQRESLQANNDRLERELSELRAQFEALRADIQADRVNGNR